MVKPWTTEEISLLTELFPSLSAAELVEHFDRPIQGLRAKAFALGLRKPKGYVAPHPKQWSAEDTERLISHFPNTTLAELAKLLNRPLAGLTSKCVELGLKKSAEYRSAYLSVNRGGAGFEKGLVPWNKKKPVVLQCKTCKNKFSVPPSQANAKFCGRPCMTAWRKTITGEAHWLDRKIECTCQWCGAAFRVKRAKVGYGEGHYCSKVCVGSALAYSMGHRNGPTSIEVKMRQALVGRGMSFVEQHPVHQWCVDFFVPSLNMIIECDGDYWHSLPEVKLRDSTKNQYFKNHGYTLHRVSETDINKRLNEVLDSIFVLENV